jgi:predicted aspartyl protease
MKGIAFLGAMVLMAANNSGQAASDNAIKVPFELVKNSIIVQVHIAEKGPFNMMMDTGVNPSAIDLRVAKDVGLTLETKGERPTGGGNDVNLAYETVLPTVSLDGVSAEKMACLAIDLSKVSEGLGRPIHGVLGYSFIKDRIIEIDFPRRILIFHSQSPWTAGALPPSDMRHTVFRFRYDNEILMDCASVNGTALVANLDTGSNSSFQISPRAVVSLGLEAQSAKGTESSSIGINGKTTSRNGTVDRISIGGISISNPKVVFYGRGTGHDNEVWGIRIGNEFLKNYVVTIDFRDLLIAISD